MSATFISQGPSVAGQQAVPPGHGPHHGGPPPGQNIHGGVIPPPGGGIQGPVPNGIPGQTAHINAPSHSQYPGNHPSGPPNSMSNGYGSQSSGPPNAGAPGSMPPQPANPQVIQKVSKYKREVIPTKCKKMIT